MARKSTTRGPHQIDIRVGSRIRLRRKMLRMSQTDLARQIGVTFQQVQKYEKGSNRIGTSRLLQICAVLKIGPAWLFQGLSAARLAPKRPDTLRRRLSPLRRTAHLRV